MKGWLVFILLTLFLCTSYTTPEQQISKVVKGIQIKTVKTLPPKPIFVEISEDSLVKALIYVESRGNANAVGDNGNAIGCLQIWPIMVKEVNRISGKNFTLEDRWNCDKSKEMFSLWRNYHHKESSVEKTARNWNGGINGYKNNSTKHYWLKIKKFFKNGFKSKHKPEIGNKKKA